MPLESVTRTQEITSTLEVEILWDLEVGHWTSYTITDEQGTTPGSFARSADIGGPRMFASPDTPGMPEPSDKTAWDFLPSGWTIETHPDGCLGHNQGAQPIRAVPNDPGFAGVQIFGQSVSFTPGVNPLGALTSNAVSMIIGS